jgi:hypothetical protein
MNQLGYLDFVHERKSDDDTPFRILQRIAPTRDRHPVLWTICMSVYDVVLTADEDPGRPVESFSRLSAWYLDKKVGSRISRFTPLANNVVETQIELIVGKHLSPKDDQHLSDDETHRIRRRTFSALLNASLVGS